MYGDINLGIENESTEIYPNEEFGITNSPAKLNRSDSILDIHTNVEFEEADLQESETEIVQPKEQDTSEDLFATMPELSKWEREEEIGAEKCN